MHPVVRGPQRCGYVAIISCNPILCELICVRNQVGIIESEIYFIVRSNHSIKQLSRALGAAPTLCPRGSSTELPINSKKALALKSTILCVALRSGPARPHYILSPIII